MFARLRGGVLLLRSAVEEDVEHFSAIQWVDFVRNVGVAAERVRMQEHMDQGCTACIRQVRTWTALAEFAGRERSYEPPPNAVRIAKSHLFSFSPALTKSADFRVLLHAFDSYDLGALHGVRGSRIAPRQLMYNFHSLFIDLRIEQPSDSECMALTGQVVDDVHADDTLDNVSVSLFGGRDPALHTTTSACGEFAFSFKVMGDLRLLLNLKDVALLLLLPQNRLTTRA